MTMETIKVYGFPESRATQRVLSAIYEKDLEYELVDVNLHAGEHKKEPFLSINPFGQVPGFRHGDLTLYESRAITRYLAEEFADRGTQLLCSHKQKPHFLLWTEIENNQFEPVASKVTWEVVVKPIFGMTTDYDVVKENVEKMEKVLDIYEAWLAKNKYLAGDEFCLADLHHQPTIQLLLETPYKAVFDARPSVAKWIADILARPAWLKVLKVEKQSE